MKKTFAARVHPRPWHSPSLPAATTTTMPQATTPLRSPSPRATRPHQSPADTDTDGTDADDGADATSADTGAATGGTAAVEISDEQAADCATFEELNESLPEVDAPAVGEEISDEYKDEARSAIEQLEELDLQSDEAQAAHDSLVDDINTMVDANTMTDELQALGASEELIRVRPDKRRRRRRLASTWARARRGRTERNRPPATVRGRLDRVPRSRAVAE